MTLPTKLLILIGAILTCSGMLLWIFGKMGIALGKLPGDLHMSLKKGSIYFPIVTSIIISIFLTIIINAILWMIKK